MNVKIPTEIYQEDNWLELISGDGGASNGLIFHLLLAHLSESHTSQFKPSILALARTLGRPASEISYFIQKAAQIGFIEVLSDDCAIAHYVDHVKEMSITAGCKRARKFREKRRLGVTITPTPVTITESVTVTPQSVTVTPQSVTSPQCINSYSYSSSLSSSGSGSSEKDSCQNKQPELKIIQRDLWHGKRGLPETDAQALLKVSIANTNRGVELYNAVADKYGLVRLDRHSVDRKSPFWRCCQDEAFLAFLEKDLDAMLECNDWFTGNNGTRWKLTADYLPKKKPGHVIENWREMAARMKEVDIKPKSKHGKGFLTDDDIENMIGGSNVCNG